MVGALWSIVDSEFNLGNGAGLVARLSFRFPKDTVLGKNQVVPTPRGVASPCCHHRVRRTEDGEHPIHFSESVLGQPLCSRYRSSLELGWPIHAKQVRDR